MTRETRTVQLKTPIQAHGEECKELKIRTPAAREYEAMDRGKGQTQQVHYLLAACASVPYPSILALEPDDYAAAMEALQSLGFQEPAPSDESAPESLATGPTSSE